MEGKNKVQFNLKNVHYAIVETSGEAVSWKTPVKVPGAVNLALEQQGELFKFYADGLVYWNAASNNGYEGDLEMALIPDQMLQDVWGMKKEADDNVIVENAFEQPKSIALLFQIDGDASERLYCLYNCALTRPGISGKTTEGTKEPQTQKCTVSATPLEDGRVMAKTSDDTSPEVKAAWFQKVYEKAATLKTTPTKKTTATKENGEDVVSEQLIKLNKEKP